MVNVPIDDGDHSSPDPATQKKNKQQRDVKVQFPDLTKDSASRPYYYARQDSDVTSSHPSSAATTDDEDSEEYDWSDEEDLVDQDAKFGERMGKTSGRRRWGCKRILSLMFSSLIGSTLFAGILITPGIILHYFWYKKDPTEHRKFIQDNVQSWLFWAAANVLVSWYLAMIIDLLPIILTYMIAAVWGHVSEPVKNKVEVYDSVKDTAKPAFYAGSAYASWIIIFASIFKLYNNGDSQHSRAYYTIRTAQVVEFFFFTVLIWCGQRMLSHFIAFSFHRTAYKERIEFVETSVGIIEKLRQYRPKNYHHKPGRTPVFGSLALSSTFSDIQHLSILSGAMKTAIPHSPSLNGNPEPTASVPTHSSLEARPKPNNKGWNRLSWLSGQEDIAVPGPSRDNSEAMDRGTRNHGDNIEMAFSSPPPPPSANMYMAAPTDSAQFSPHKYPPPNLDSGTNVDGMNGSTPLRQAARVLKYAVLHDARNLTGESEELGGLYWNVNSAHEAKRLARSIYMRFKDQGRNWLISADFYPAFHDHAAAEDAFKVFDKDNNGDLSRAEIKTALLRIYKERRLLSRSMRDVGEALKTLNRILLFFAGVIVFFIALSVFGVSVGDSLSSVYTLGIAASFIFKNTASNAFDAIMFLFVSHPYDTGDRVIIDTENLIVKRVGLFATVFNRADGTETYYFNSQLFTKFILNVRRSGKTFENLTMQVAWKTPLDKLDALEKCLNAWLSTEENRWFEPSTNITLQNISYQRYLELTIGIGHNGNWQDWGLRNQRKTAFHAAVQYYCRELGIVGYEATLPIVYANQNSLTYEPESSSPLPDSPPSPLTEGTNATRSIEQIYQEARESEIDALKMKPILGFLPPLADRSSHLTRARKSKNRKENLGAGNA